MSDGFILLHRKLRDNVLWPKNKAFTKTEAWIDLLMMARFDKEPIEILLGNEVVMCGRGQIVRSINTYQKRWNWGAQRVKSFFEILLKLNQIEKKTTTKTTIITICNYASYQGKQQTDNKRITNGKQTDNKRITIKNNDNKENKENNDNKTLAKNEFLHEREVLNNVYNLFDFEIVKKLTETQKYNWLDTINKLNRIDGYEFLEIEKTIIWGRNDEFWKSNFHTIPTLRKKKNDISKFFQINKKMNYEAAGKNGNSDRENEFIEFTKHLAENLANDPDLK